ncbi:MAG: class II aldolase/adducin family protein [Dehalococcoidia bacterium]
MISPELMATFFEVGKDLYSLGLVSSHGGNLSVRNGHEMWITGTGTMLGRLRERHMSLVLPDGTHTGPPPSSDTLLHSTVYALGGAQAVVHAHPHHAIAMTFETLKFVPPDFEGQHFLEDVPVVPQGPNQVEQIAAALQSRLVVILQGHGAYARGQTLWEALHWITALEESAHIAWLRR